ncbi:MAG: carboxylating nicotinate-nucleotide diphosphorylase [Oscillospiraceae bacterium]|nr:carboxylating nicotinate-nucleotide diphosphorylase [Oscillospiraceae bacterium]
MNINKMAMDELLKNALKEDIGTGDITTSATVLADKSVRGRFVAKADGIICGLFVCERVFELIDDKISFSASKKDGEAVRAGEEFAQVSGNAQSLLTGERTALNFLQRLSGIATKTAKTIESLAGFDVLVADTRKTTPGLRIFEKYAVKTGGGTNHRFNLSDGILIKDNHIAAAGGIAKAVALAKKNAPHTLKIEVECENLDDVAEALLAGADIIMLDNMSLPQMKAAVELIGGRAKTEASGNMGEKDLCEIAKTGVDIISIGALTHSAGALDISLKFCDYGL